MAWVHVVDKALAGNTDLVADYIESEGHFKLYGEALHATGLRDALTLLDDETYVPATSKPADDPYSGSANFPKTKNYRYTALLETDSVLALNGIRSLEDMRAYARTYFPEGKDLPDTDERSSLYRFVAYHLLPVMLTSNQIVNTRDYVMTHTWIDADWLRENYRAVRFGWNNIWCLWLTRLLSRYRRSNGETKMRRSPYSMMNATVMMRNIRIWQRKKMMW